MRGFKCRFVCAFVLAVYLPGWSAAAWAQGCYISSHGDYICDNYSAPKTQKAPAQRPAYKPIYNDKREAATRYREELEKARQAELDRINKESRERAAQYAAESGANDVAPSCPVAGNVIPVNGNTMAALEAAIAKAKPGDTILLPAGTISINKEIKIKNGVSLKGAGRDKTVLKWTGGAGAMIAYQCSGNQQVTVSDIAFEGRLSPSTDRMPHSGLELRDCKGYRVYNSEFRKFVRAGVVSGGKSTGVIDHNRFMNNWMGNGKPRYGYGVQVGGWGRDLWNQPLKLGGADTVTFIEDNYFEGNKHGVAGGGGSQYTVRYNTFKAGKNIIDGGDNNLHQIDMHGNYGGRATGFGGRAYEIYNNTVISSKTSWTNSINVRGGDGVIFGNKTNAPIKVSSDSDTPYSLTKQVNVWGNQAPDIINQKPGKIPIKTTPLPGYKPYVYPHPLASCGDGG